MWLNSPDLDAFSLFPPTSRHYHIEAPGDLTKEKAISVVEKIIAQFKHLVEDRRYSSELYRENRSPRPEKSAQKFFFAVADCYCKANNLDITPEADTGAGSVDFKFSIGYACRVLVEIKLSTNAKLVDGFDKQITAYTEAEDAVSSFYVVIDVGHMGRKDELLYRLSNKWQQKARNRPEIRLIDGKLRPSASKRS
ncbi:MAG: hypothetical protein ACLQBA_03230 [Candidatus Binataceae bacterium]